MKTIKTTKLVVDYDYDFEVLALISSVKDYKLAWALNKTLQINLSKTEDICLDFIKEGRLLISNFIFETEYATFRLLKNRSGEAAKGFAKPFLLPELKEYDFIIMISGESASMNAEKTMEKLKNLSLVEYVKPIEIETLKSRENLIF
jgi:hypothetical protein